MGLVRLQRPGPGLVAFVDPTIVRMVCSHPANGDQSILRFNGSDEDFIVRGTPDEVHAALFPPTPVVGPAYPAEGSDPTIYLPMPDVAEALDPTTYKQEWADYSPEKVRAMCFALGLIRARLGVGE